MIYLTIITNTSLPLKCDKIYKNGKKLCLFMSILQFILQEKQIKGLIDAQNKAKHILCLDFF